MPLSQKKLIPSILLMLALAAFAVPPLWWSAGVPPVIAPGAIENNQGPANIGQAKHMAKSALDALRPILPAVADEIEADLTEGTNPILDFTIPDSKTPEWLEKQKAPLLIGQLKAISAPFYTRLNATNPTWLEAERTTNGTNITGSIFPWTTTTDDDANQAIATIGQLKAVFSLRFESLPPQDSDGDGMPDAFETAYGLNPNASSDASGDQDSDGLTNLHEYQKGTNPNNPDTDGDGLTDEQEISLGTDANNPDTDTDGLTDEQEILLGTNPLVSDNPGIAQESIANGDFTNPRIKTGIMRYSDWDVWTSMPYWTAIVGSNIEYQTIEPLAAGNQYCELKAHTSGHHGIQQTIGTVKGKTYLIVLDCKARSGDALTDSEFKMVVDDKATPSRRNLDQTVTFSDFNWTQAAATFTATTSITTIGLLPTNLTKPTRGCLVDNVRLIPMDLLPVDLDIVHPATGEVAEGSEDSTSAFVEKGKGGLVAIRRNTDTPLTKLVISALPSLPLFSRFRLKFDSTLTSGKIKIWNDPECTDPVISGQTEFSNVVDRMVYVEGVKEGLGGDLRILQEIKINGAWYGGDKVSIAVVHAEIPVVLRAFIPHAWTEGEAPFPVQLFPIPWFSRTLGGDRQNFSLKSYEDEDLYRLKQEIIMTPYRELHDEPDIRSERKADTAALTRYYDRSEDVPLGDQNANFGETFVPGATPNWPFVPPDPTQTYEDAGRDGEITHITVSLSGEPGTPESIPEGPFPNIDTKYVIKMERMENGSNPFIRVTMDVTHDLYPAYEGNVGMADGTYQPVYRNMPEDTIFPGPDSVGTSMEGQGGPFDIH